MDLLFTQLEKYGFFGLITWFAEITSTFTALIAVITGLPARSLNVKGQVGIRHRYTNHTPTIHHRYTNAIGLGISMVYP